MSFVTRFRRSRTVEDDRTPGRARRIAARVATVLAGLLLLAALLLPDRLTQLTPGAFLRIPLEAIAGLALLLALPPRPRQVLAGVAGAVLGALAIVKVLDMGFRSAFDRPFDLVLDWLLLDDAAAFIRDGFGRTGAIGAVVGAVLLVVALLALGTLAALRVSRAVVRHRTAATRAAAALTAAWVVFAVLGAQVVPDLPVASDDAATLLYDRVAQVRAGLQDQQDFAEEAAVDAFRDVPGDQLLTALRGKDVVVTFIESYGRDALEDPEFAPHVGAVLDTANSRLTAAGYASQSAFLTSPTTGGRSWLAHATLLSGLWINNEQRYRNLVSSDRLTLNTAFGRADWRTVGVLPAITRAWPEGKLYGYDTLYELRNLGYRGVGFGFATMPDQYTLSAFERFEHGKAGRGPLMAQITLLSSHAPWTPLPRMIDWNAVGDGSIYLTVREGDPADEVWRDRDRVRTQYRLSVEYTLSALLSYVENYGDDDLVMIFLGDHQPSPIVVGENANRDVPITILTRDRAVLDRISSWGWQDGLKPSPQAPVWRMDTFRDRFLTAYGPTP